MQRRFVFSYANKYFWALPSSKRLHRIIHWSLLTFQTVELELVSLCVVHDADSLWSRLKQCLSSHEYAPEASVIPLFCGSAIGRSHQGSTMGDWYKMMILFNALWQECKQIVLFGHLVMISQCLDGTKRPHIFQNGVELLLNAFYRCCAIGSWQTLARRTKMQDSYLILTWIAWLLCFNPCKAQVCLTCLTWLTTQ